MGLVSMYGAASLGAYAADRYYKSNTSILGGQVRNKGTSKRVNVARGQTGVIQDTRTLYVHNLINIQRNDTTTPSDSINKRQRDIIYVSGSKICYEFCNISSSVTDEYEINMCLITPRCRNTTSTLDFFRDSEFERSKNFGTDLSSLEFNCLPVNSDEYNVIWRKRFKLLSKVANSQGRWNKKVQLYIPIKRQFRFDDGNVTPDCPQPQIVYWIDKVCTNGGSAVIPGVLDLTHRIDTYFREPK